MKRLVKSADLSDEERETALGWLENKVELDTEAVDSLSEEARKGIYRAAARLAAVDLDVADEERNFLNKLRDGLKLSEDDVSEIEQSIPALAKSDD